MTAGSGIVHSEQNNEDSPLRFIQIWITPRARGLTPAYGSFDGSSSKEKEARRNKLVQLVGDKRQSAHSSVPVRIEQDCSMFVSELDPSKGVDFSLQPGRQAYLLSVEGALLVTCDGKKTKLERHAAAEIRGDGELRISASDETASHFLLLEMAEGSGGRGRGF